ncbi:YrhK family protein [Nisaea sp.]|uniref:YrhK family protein n=1 Tax=Nisaea sp. TaxID=2024842 RepID=UPI003266AD00
MPHFFAHRPRSLALFRKEANARHHFLWETINAVVYLLGGAIFVFGSIFFFPTLSAWQDVGAAAFVLGSVLYLIVTAHDFAEVMRHCRADRKDSSLRRKFDLSAATAYLTGTVLFTVGSAFFLSAIDWTEAGAWCFIIGSGLFLFGSTINILQIVFTGNIITLQLMNLTAVNFVVGSVLFCVASVPYLWSLQTSADRHLLDTFLAWLFVVGSALFVVGGFFNYWRAWLLARRAILSEAMVAARNS